ncbi:MAG TPA: toll/interleukin-1 receptor domain-containing protein [Bryobacteraceae bacterium]|jgi:hypothetical protein|nr:toll/interleukin-1 receptor domain-containing protein [Bryobacteraceae bacterium]
MRKVFISYTTETKPQAQLLSQELEKKGISSWLDFKDLKPGQQWRVELERAADKATCFLILFRAGSSATPQLEAEWQVALKSAWNSDKALIPVIFGESEPPAFLRSWAGLHVKAGTDTSTWTEQVFEALTSQSRSLAPAPSEQERSVRQKRFDELAEAAYSLKESFREPDQ